jgi:hypothetical protein
MTDLNGQAGSRAEVVVHQILLGLPLENTSDLSVLADRKCSLRTFLVLVCR